MVGQSCNRSRFNQHFGAIHCPIQRYNVTDSDDHRDESSEFSCVSFGVFVVEGDTNDFSMADSQWHHIWPDACGLDTERWYGFSRRQLCIFNADWNSRCGNRIAERDVHSNRRD